MTDPTGCTCQANGRFIDCPRHDAAMRSPEQEAADLEALRETRRLAGIGTDDHPDKGKFGGIERRWDDYAGVKA